MKTIRRLDSSGDTCIQFDDSVETAEKMVEAKKMFDAWMASKQPAFMTKRAEGKPDEKVTSFDKIEEGSEVVLVPAIVAG